MAGTCGCDEVVRKEWLAVAETTREIEETVNLRISKGQPGAQTGRVG